MYFNYILALSQILSYIPSFSTQIKVSTETNNKLIKQQNPPNKKIYSTPKENGNHNPIRTHITAESIVCYSTISEPEAFPGMIIYPVPLH